MVGTVDSAELILTGRPIRDSDGDGLDDLWEQQFFGNLDHGPREDPDGDGWNNAAEQMAGTNPVLNETPFAATLSVVPGSGERPRLSWPSVPGATYEIWTATRPGKMFTRWTNAPGTFPESAWFLPGLDSFRLLQVRTVPE
jgi:hypothetical protein